MRNRDWNKFVIIVIFLLASFFTETASAAVAILPGSVNPGLVGKNYLPPPQPKLKLAPKVTAPAQEGGKLGPEAKKIKFKLNKIVLENNHVYSDEQLEALYHDKLHTEISIADLEQIVQEITNYYRNNGYVLSRAILPPQHVKEGIVHVQIIEGFIDKVKIVGNPRGARRLIMEYGNQIAQSRPLQFSIMEHNLLLANQIPGATVKAVLEPSKTTTGASDLNLVVDLQPVNASLSYDNYGTLYIGPHQITATTSANSAARAGDMTRLTYLAATHGAELHYADLSYLTPINDSGLSLLAGGNQSLTAPGFVLGPLDTDGIANTYYASLQYPLILTRSQYLILDGGLTYLDSKVTQLDVVLIYNDHLRPIRFGGAYNFVDGWNGTNNIAFHISQGLNIWGASDDPQSITTSHFGADGVFTKETMQISRIQPLWSTPLSLYVLAQGQYSNKPLLASEQFGFGGSQVGRGYDPAEILGDRGAAGSVELRLDGVFAQSPLTSVQFYLFYDIGKIWNVQNLPDIKQNQSASSTGIGSRFSITRNISGNIMFTQVLTKSIASEELINRGRNSKTYFNLVILL